MLSQPPRGSWAPTPLYYHEGGRGRALLDPLLSQGGVFASLGYWAAGLRCMGYLCCPCVPSFPSVFTFFGATTSQRPSYLIKTPHHHHHHHHNTTEEEDRADNTPSPPPLAALFVVGGGGGRRRRREKIYCMQCLLPAYVYSISVLSI